MFLPIGDSPNLAKTPWVTLTLITLNVAIHLLVWPLDSQVPHRGDPRVVEYATVLVEERGAPMERLRISRGDLVRFEHGIKPGRFEIRDAFASMFLHGSWMHLLGNMLFLWIFGDNIEHRLGRGAFLAAYLGTGLVAVFGDTALRLGSSIPSVGASGAISGVLGLYFLWFPRNQVRVFVFLFPFFMKVIELSARLVLGFYLVIDNILPLLLTGGAGGVSYGAHIGGFLAGLGIAAFGRGRMPRSRPGRRPPPVDSVAASESLSPESLSADLRRALSEGRDAEALRLFLDAPRMARRSLDPAQTLVLGERLEDAGQGRAALAVFQRTLADHPVGPGRPRAHLGAARVLLRQLGEPTAAYQHLYAAVEDGASAEEASAARSLLAELESRARSVPRRGPWG